MATLHCGGFAANADLVVEIRVVLTDLPTRHHVHVNGRELPDPPLMLVITDPATHEQLWSALERRRMAIQQKIADLKARVDVH